MGLGALMILGFAGGCFGLVLVVTSFQREHEEPPIPPAQAVTSGTSPIVPTKTRIRIMTLRLAGGLALLIIAVAAIRLVHIASTLARR